MAASTLQARRDARKRRILENSENRLQKIFGKQESSSQAGASVDIKDDETHGADVPKSNGNTPVLLEHLPNPVAHHVNHFEGDYSGEITDHVYDDAVLEEDQEDLTLSLDRLLGKALDTKDDPQLKEEPKCTPSVLQSIISRRIHIILLAILVRLLFAFNYGFLFGENLLMPFFVVELTEILMADEESPSGSSGMLGAALLLSGIIPRRVTLISNIYNRTSKLLQNLCLYLFTFIIFYAILEWPG